MTSEQTGPETLLLVDDDQLAIEPACALLERDGYHVICVNSGKQAVDVVQQSSTKIDLVMLDMLMPEMDGLETFKRIRQTQPDIPVLLASGYLYSEQVEAMMQGGCNGFIQKPYGISELRPKIRAILAQTKK